MNLYEASIYVDRDIMGKCYIYIHIVVFIHIQNVTYNCWLIRGCDVMRVCIYIYTHIYLNMYVCIINAVYIGDIMQ